LLGQGYAIAPQQAARTRRHGLAPDGAARDRSAERLHGARAYSIRRTTARTGGPSWMPCAMRAIVGYSPNCSSRAWPPGGWGGAWSLPRGRGLPPQRCPPSYLAHADPVCYTRAQDGWKQGACSCCRLAGVAPCLVDR